MKNWITSLFIITTLYALCIFAIKPALAAPSNGNIEAPRNRARGVSRYHSRATQYGRMKPDTFINDFGGKFVKNNLSGEFSKIIPGQSLLSDDDDIFDLSKRQQPNSDDYGHLRFGKRDEQFDDYGHMRFGRGERK